MMKFVNFIVIVIVSITAYVLSEEPSESETEPSQVYIEQSYSDAQDATSLYDSILNSSEISTKLESLECDVCKSIMKEVNALILSNPSRKVINSVAVVVCQLIHARGYCPKPFYSWQCRDICSGAIPEFSAAIVPLLVMANLDPQHVCWKLKFRCEKPVPEPELEPPEDVLTEPEPVTTTTDRDENEKRLNEIGHFVLFGDLHWDDLYTNHSVANCGEPVCCRKKDDRHSYHDAVEYAGPYGNYGNCDVPTVVIDSMLAYLSEMQHQQYNLDFGLWVGDATPHDVWVENKQNKIRIQTQFTNKLKTTLQIPFFIAIGNHEMVPIDQFSGPPLDSWLYSNLSALWAEWIDNEYVVGDTVKPSQLLAFGGYYTSLIKPGLRVIALNTGYMESGNDYLKWTNTSRDIASQLKWLRNILSQSQNLAEDVFILQHYPLNHFSYHYLQNAYYSVYQQFSSIITAVFCGHTHSNTYSVLSTADNVPFAVEFNAATLTTRGGHNPQFRIYKYNRTNNKLLDYEHFAFNVTDANRLQSDEHQWIKLYEMKKSFGMQSFTAQAFVDNAVSFADEDENQTDVVTKFHKYQYYHRGGYLPNGRISKSGKNKTICSLITSTKDRHEYCRKNQFP